MIEAWMVADDDLARRVGARRLLESSQRVRVYCRRCGRKIPQTRRRDAVYCSAPCKDRHRRDERDALRGEVARAARALARPTSCRLCGGPLEDRGASGPPPAAHRACLRRAEGVRYRARKRARGRPERSPQEEMKNDG